MMKLGVVPLALPAFLAFGGDDLAKKPQGRLGEIEELMSKADPMNDDEWQSEKEYTHAKHRLDDLAKKLIAERSSATPDVAALFTKDCRLSPLRPPGGKTVRAGDLQVLIAGPGTTGGGVPVDAAATSEKLDPSAAFGALLEPFRKATDLRFEFKVVDVKLREDHRFSTGLFFQAYGKNPDGAVQQNAYWVIDWAPGKDDDHPEIEGIAIRDFHETAAPRNLFAECSTGIVKDAAAWEQLQWGGDYWYGKIDAVGELNLYGHNGIAVGDVNGDGLDDLYVAMGTGIPNKLFIQNPDGTARECASEWGADWLDDTKGVLLIDFDNDGDQDLFTTMGPTILLSANDGKGKFVPTHAMRAGTDASFYSLSAADYDLDGDLDVYGVRYVRVRYGESLPIPLHDATNGPPNHLMRNDGDKGFSDVTEEAGLNANNNRFSLASGWADYDNDGDPDLYVSNDFGRNNLYRNDGGRFVDVAAQAGVEDQAAGMGVSWADYDLDGDLDLHVSNMFSSAGRRVAYQPKFKEGQEGLRRQIQHHALGNSLFANSGNGSFRDASDVGLGVRLGRWAWGAMFADINNDGYGDIISPNGFVTGALKDDL